MRKRNQRQSQKFLQNLGDSIRGRRIELALSQEGLGLECSVHRSYITEIENGMRNVSVLTLNKIAKALKVEVWELLRFERDGNHDGKG